MSDSSVVIVALQIACEEEHKLQEKGGELVTTHEP